MNEMRRKMERYGISESSSNENMHTISCWLDCGGEGRCEGGRGGGGEGEGKGEGVRKVEEEDKGFLKVSRQIMMDVSKR